MAAGDGRRDPADTPRRSGLGFPACRASSSSATPRPPSGARTTTCCPTTAARRSRRSRRTWSAAASDRRGDQRRPRAPSATPRAEPRRGCDGVDRAGTSTRPRTSSTTHSPVRDRVSHATTRAGSSRSSRRSSRRPCTAGSTPAPTARPTSRGPRSRAARSSAARARGPARIGPDRARVYVGWAAGGRVRPAARAAARRVRALQPRHGEHRHHEGQPPAAAGRRSSRSTSTPTSTPTCSPTGDDDRGGGREPHRRPPSRCGWPSESTTGSVTEHWGELRSPEESWQRRRKDYVDILTRVSSCSWPRRTACIVGHAICEQEKGGSPTWTRRLRTSWPSSTS